MTFNISFPTLSIVVYLLFNFAFPSSLYDIDDAFGESIDGDFCCSFVKVHWR